MVHIDRESYMINPVAAYFNRKSYCMQERELHFYEYRIDLYSFSKKINSTIAVELKIHNWRRAFEQAMIYQLCADYVFIAMPSPIVHRIDLELLDRHGIGIITMSDKNRCREIIEARQSPEVRPYYKNNYIEELKREGGCHR